MIRATHGVHMGSYYYEVEILPQPLSKSTVGRGRGDVKEEENEGHVRIGWSTRQGELQGPVGFDQYSFGYRDTEGEC